jgi:putative hydrolase
MSDLPFGFTPPEQPEGGMPGGMDLGRMLQDLGRMMSTAGSGPVSWDAAGEAITQGLSTSGNPGLTDADRTSVADAVRIADVWLDDATSLPATAAMASAWSRGEWVDRTLPSWKRLIEPLAVRVQDAMGASMSDLGGSEMPEGMDPMSQQLMSQLMGAMKPLGAYMFGTQVGSGLASLATEVLSAGDVGIPLTDDGRPSLVPTNIHAFGAGLGIASEDVLLFAALRESAHQRLFAHVPWLRSRVLAAVEEYAAGIDIDAERIRDLAGNIDPTNPEALQDALNGGMFDVEPTPKQQAALARLETLLALTEGWVDHVVRAAASERLPAADALGEAVRRRRAVGGPAEKTFESLVGLELRPKRLREAAALWDELYKERGATGRDAVWEHPDFLPTAEDLDDPSGFVRGSAPTDFDDISDLGLDLPAPDPQDPETDANPETDTRPEAE